MRKRIIVFLLAAITVLPAMAQETREQFETRYNTLVKNLGLAGVGIETLLERWEAAYPDDPQVYENRFLYFYEKSRSVEMSKIEADRYLGQAPALSLKDSLGNNVNWFEVYKFDDELFGKGIASVDQAIQMSPDRLDYRLAKITALTEYEKESPDMAAAELRALIDYNKVSNPKWEYPGVEVDKEFFDASIQDFCYIYFRNASPACYEAFREISQKMLDYDSGNVLFMDNMGSYYLVAKNDTKTALKYYNKVLKAKKDDLTAIKNCILIARRDKNIKLEKKYLPMMVKYADNDTDRNSAQARLDYYNGKK